MKAKWLPAVAIIALIVGNQAALAGAKHRIGIGAMSWQMLDDVSVENIDENGLSWIVTYQYQSTPLWKWEIDVV